MRDNRSDKTIERNLMQKWCFFIRSRNETRPSGIPRSVTT